MKRKLIIFISILAMLAIFIPINADESFNILKWSFVMLTDEADQDENVYVSKYYNVDDKKKYAFCLQPEIGFKPMTSTYECKKYDNEYIYKLVKAYSKLGDIENLRNDDYYIATQLLIWNYVSKADYTFNGNDYSKQKKDILDLVNEEAKLYKSNNIEVDAYLNEEYSIDSDYTKYNFEADGIEITQNDEKTFKFIVKDELPVKKTICFTPKESDDSKMYQFVSETSQNLYYFDGEYSELEPFNIDINTLLRPSTIDIKYSKVDESNKPISGTEFKLYVKDDKSSQYITFINTDVDINLYDALINDTNNDKYKIEVSERYSYYLNGEFMNTSEKGYFPYKIYLEDTIVKQGIVYVTDNRTLTNGTYNNIPVSVAFEGLSSNSDINAINDIPRNNEYYLCESEPKKGYTYLNNPCVIIDGQSYDNETIKFVNRARNYTLKLMKQSPEEILLDGAKFRITYDENDNQKSIEFVTGSLCIDQKDNNLFLIYKYENDDNVYVEKFEDSSFIKSDAKPGKYYYYQSNDSNVDIDRLKENCQSVVDGGFVIENLPYSSLLTIEELKAPKGYVIDEPIYRIEPDISYSEITFKNYRINSMDIIPGKKFPIPKTCVN